MNIEIIDQIRVFANKFKILYVEDDDLIREEVNLTLGRIFSHVDLARDGAEGLALYTQNKYDIVLTDIEMPKMGGIELSQEIININSDQNILIISAHKNSTQLLKLIDIGISGIILKPIDIDRLISKLYRIVKEIYAEKMMKYHYEEVKKQLGDKTKTHEELQKKDPLTSVYNYKYLLSVIKNDRKKAAILFNINDFKLINERYSHNHGNHLLFQFASLLVKESKKYNCSVFRVSGDEFLYLYENNNIDCNIIKRDVIKIIQKIRDTKFSVIEVKGINIDVRVSYTCSNDRLLEELTMALDYAKKFGLTSIDYQEFIKHNLNVQNILEVKDMLKNAIKDNSIVPVYQPIVMLNNDVKYEVLMRIEEKNHKLLTPDKFLEIAKTHNFYSEISEILIFKALEEMKKLNKNFSINLSYLDIRNNSFLDKLESKLIEYNMASRVVFEIIESDTIYDMQVVHQFIQRFKKLGVQIAIDDFGSGYSNFVYILQLEPDYIKLDGSLIVNILSDEKILIFVKTIIDLAHKLGMKVIAEFVSSKELYNVLHELNVDAMQGYYLGYPDKEILESKDNEK